MSATSNTGQVIIFKAPVDSVKEQGDVYYDMLSENGFNVTNVPVLDFEFVSLGELLAKLKRPEDYSGIIFSSPRCVKACKLAVEKELDSIWEQWKYHKNYAVGETTAKLAEEIELITYGKESGNANALADIITKGEYQKPFLYPIGSLTNNNFKLKLKESNIDVDDIVIYITKPHPQLKQNLSELLNKIDPVDPVYFLYFSPSGVNYSLPILKELRFNLDHVKFLAIGPTTESSLKQHGLEIYKTISKPTPVAALQALTS